MVITNNSPQQINTALFELENKIRQLESAIKQSNNNIETSKVQTNLSLSSGQTYDINITGSATRASYADNSGTADNASHADTADIASNVPTKTSQLQNDSGFITDADIPTKTSDLINDSNFSSVEANPVLSGDESDLTSLKIEGTKYKIAGGNGNIVELTQAEYDDLTPEEKANGTVYVISDSDQEQVDFGAMLIDDSASALNKTYSSSKINAELDKRMLLPDMSAPLYTFPTTMTEWTATEDCYFTSCTCSSSTADNTNYHVWLNGVDITTRDTSTNLAIWIVSGFARKGDVIKSATVRTKVYALTRR